METGKKLFQKLTHRKPDDLMRRPRTSDLTTRVREKVYSGFDAQVVGYAEELSREALYTDQDKRLNMHILGAPGQGKSKFIELLAEWNIGREPIVLIDSTQNAKTATNLLKHCILKGHDKVCLIDPSDFEEFSAVPILKPLKLTLPPEVSVNNISDILRVLWESKFEQTRRVERYVPAVLKALWEAKLTLAELVFMLYREFSAEREVILEQFKNNRDPAKMTLLSAYRHGQYDQHFLPSVNTLDPFLEDHIKLLVGSKKLGVPWTRFIRERWVVIVNLNPTGAWGQDEKSRKLLGTMIISEVIDALSREVARGRQAPLSMYIDEVGHYATPKLANILNHQRHLNMRLTLAHQEFHQIKDTQVLHAILTSAQNKVLFYTPNDSDRELMMANMGYGGEIPDRILKYNLGQLEKQKASMRLGRTNPEYVKVKYIADPDVSDEQLTAFKKQIYKSWWYASPENINAEINARFPEEQYAPPSISKRAANAKGNPGAAANVKNKGAKKGNRRTPAAPVSDDSPNSEAVLQPQKGRPAVEIPWD